MSRTQERLERAESEIKTINSKISTRIVRADLTLLKTFADYEQLVKVNLKEMDIGILIDNAGMPERGDGLCGS